MNRWQTERREQLIFGRNFDRAYYAPGGLAYFDHLDVGVVRKLFEEGFFDLDRKYQGALSVEEMIRFCLENDEDDEKMWYFHGFAISPERIDCRVTIEGMGSYKKPSKQGRERFYELHQNASVLSDRQEETCYCWYD